MAGDEVTGATTFRLEEGLDAGPVRLSPRRSAPTTPRGDLLDRLAESGAGLLVATLDGIEARRARGASRSPPTAVSSPRSSPSTTRRSTGRRPAFAVDRQVRACTPAPGAWTTFGGDAAQARARSTPRPDRDELGARRGRGGQAGGPGRHRRPTPSSSARCSPAGKQRMRGRRLGPRRARRPRHGWVDLMADEPRPRPGPDDASTRPGRRRTTSLRAVDDRRRLRQPGAAAGCSASAG